MKEFDAKTICILGRQPSLGLAELESLYGAEHVREFAGNALLDIDFTDIDFQRLGGTIKVAKILSTGIGSSWSAVEKYLLKTIPQHTQYLPPGKFTLGISNYGLPASPNDINKTGLKIKKLVKSADKPVRIVPNKTNELSSAQVLHNQLTHQGGWELLVISNGKQTLLAQTMFVQDIEAYAARDQARPARDARVGMLPPKLAQIIVNLAVGRLDDKRWETVDSPTILDPFCGTGVVLQEALLMGCHVIGTDIEPRMIKYSQKNVDWLSKTHKNYSGFLKYLEAADATSHKWRDTSFDAVACETYLGRPLSSLPEPAKLNEVVQDVNTILSKFLKNLAKQAKPDTRICLAIPAWNLGNHKFKHLPVIDQLTDMGYNLLKFEHISSEDLIYYRENQVVARQLIVIQKK